MNELGLTIIYTDQLNKHDMKGQCGHHDIIIYTTQHRDARFGFKVGQIDPKRDKSGTFSDQISVHLARSSQTY